jgi:hypothetical protein
MRRTAFLLLQAKRSAPSGVSNVFFCDRVWNTQEKTWYNTNKQFQRDFIEGSGGKAK